MPEYKPLVHDTVKGFALPGQDGKWLDHASEIIKFIKNIKTRPLDLNADVGAIISGVPTVFARTNLFRSAIDQGGGTADTANLAAYYALLLSEWKGVIACIALESEQIAVNRIYLKYTDGLGNDSTQNLYEPKGAFGNMLFNRRELWSEQGSNSEHKGIPFVDVIKYKGKVIGGTSPESLLFTSADYSNDTRDRKPYINGVTGRFINPLDETSTHPELNAQQAGQLIAYINHLLKNISTLESYYEHLDGDLKPDYGRYTRILDAWKTDIENFATSKTYTTQGSIPTVTCFKDAPYNRFFNHSDALYGENGIIYDIPRGAAVEFKPKQLLLPEDNTKIVRLRVNGLDKNATNLNSSIPVYYLRAQKKSQPNEFEFFALPLSPLGLKVFGDNLIQFLGYDKTNGSFMKAIYDDSTEELNITITLKVQGSDRPTIPVSVKYKVASKSLRGKDIILWPNFRSSRWNRYFLYSEITHNQTTQDVPFMSVPFVGENDTNFSTIEGQDGEPLYLAKDEQICVPQDNSARLKAKLHVLSTVIVSTNNYKYEIYESNKPFKGIRLMTGTKEDAGFLIIRYEATPSKDTIARKYSGMPQETSTPTPVTLGVDFGSTNSSIAFKSGNDEAKGFTLKNHRISLLPEKKENRQVAKENEILFFQAQDVASNSIKSVLTVHDERRLNAGDMDRLSREITGGFPCVENNLPVVSVGLNSVDLMYDLSIKEVRQVINMKWMSDDAHKAHMTAFMRTLLLQVYADLYTMIKDQPMVPEKINWAFPAAMPQSLVTNYSTQIWDQLGDTAFDHPIDHHLEIASFIPTKVDLGADTTPYAGKPVGMGGMSGGMGGMSGGMGGMSGGMGGMSGGMGSMPGGMGSMFGSMGGEQSAQQVGIDLESLLPSNEPIRFKFQQLASAGCLTEACAVANDTKKQPGVDDTRALTLCFDIGGSTSDISALCMMKQTPQSPPTIAMVKQSSIQFAAQRIGNATRYCKNLKKVLLSVCSQYAESRIEVKNLFHRIEANYKQDTAPYYYEQVVNTLDNDQLKTLYKVIRSDCPELMAVNLYVTGLIIFYAGQLTWKLVTDIQADQEEKAIVEKPIINIRFAGKGSRIFEWFQTEQQFANQYYNNMFLAGIGGLEEAKKIITNFYFMWPSNQFDGSSNVKYEVSKGLADLGHGNGNTVKLLVPQDNDNIELIGEDSFELSVGGKSKELEHTDTITPSMMQYIGSYFNISSNYYNNQCPQFARFLDLYGGWVIRLLQFKMTPEEFMTQCANMNITTYIKNLPDFKKAEANRKFDYVAPIFVLEGMKFYDSLIQTIKNKY